MSASLTPDQMARISSLWCGRDRCIITDAAGYSRYGSRIAIDQESPQRNCAGHLFRQALLETARSSGQRCERGRLLKEDPRPCSTSGQPMVLSTRWVPSRPRHHRVWRRAPTGGASPGSTSQSGSTAGLKTSAWSWEAWKSTPRSSGRASSPWTWPNGRWAPAVTPMRLSWARIHSTPGAAPMADGDPRTSPSDRGLAGIGHSPEGLFSSSWTANARRCSGSTDRNSVIAVSAWPMYSRA